MQHKPKRLYQKSNDGKRQGYDNGRQLILQKRVGRHDVITWRACVPPLNYPDGTHDLILKQIIDDWVHRAWLKRIPASWLAQPLPTGTPANDSINPNEAACYV